MFVIICIYLLYSFNKNSWRPQTSSNAPPPVSFVCSDQKFFKIILDTKLVANHSQNKISSMLEQNPSNL